MIRPTIGYSFDDLLLTPQYSEVLPTEVDVSTKIGHLKLSIPILSSAMDTVTELSMAIAMAKLGGLGIVHKNLPALQQSDIVKEAVDVHGCEVGFAIGPGSDYQSRLELCTEAGAKTVVVDTAHGHSKGVIDVVKYARSMYPYLTIIAGNVVTASAASALGDAGASAVKCGVGGGSICTTRIISGCGVPQLTAIDDVVRGAQQYDMAVIADGGIKHPGDITKALAAGADAVMIGGLLAGCDESPGAIVEKDGKKYKPYRGMGSLDAMQKGSKDRYGRQHVASEKLVPEGVSGLVESKGPAAGVINQLVGGLRSGMGYLGARSITQLQHRAVWVSVSSAGQKESHVHSLAFVEKTVNYG